MINYAIEDIALDHPALLTGNFQACTVVRCRQFGTSPWQFEIDCRIRPGNGTCRKICGLGWQDLSEAEADKAERTCERERLTEDAAVGASVATLAALSEGEITEVTQRGTGVDYWVDNKRAIIEISGIENGTKAESNARHVAKTKQLKRGRLFVLGFPGYVFVMNFGNREAVLSYSE